MSLANPRRATTPHISKNSCSLPCSPCAQRQPNQPNQAPTGHCSSAHDDNHRTVHHAVVGTARRHRVFMSFGFSVGDFIALGNIAIKTYALLQDSTGSSADYQSLKLIRKSFGATLATVEAELQTTVPNSLPKPLVNAAKIHLSGCSQLLQSFDEITKKYDASLSPGGSGRKTMDTLRKLKWGSVKDDTRELFRLLQGHIQAVEILFNCNNT